MTIQKIIERIEQAHENCDAIMRGDKKIYYYCTHEQDLQIIAEEVSK
jgi:hypothetical protein